MPDRVLRLQRIARATAVRAPARRPVMIAIAGDSAAGKTTLSGGLATLLGPGRVTTICVDDYHRYDREERRKLPFTALHPDCNYIGIMEQHLQLLATGEPILKPVYDHRTGQLARPELVCPGDFVIAEGLLPLHTKLARACFDIAVYLDPPEEIRRRWKIDRGVGKRGYDKHQVEAELQRREQESADFIRPQREYADVVVRFAPISEREDPPGTPLSAKLLLRPTIRHPDLSKVLAGDRRWTIHLKLDREENGRPVDALHIHGYAPREDSQEVEKAIWAQLGLEPGDPIHTLGHLANGERSEPLAITQLILLYHMLDESR
ncbi:phosphoribulokinase [Fodinicola feengrottensis]|uniref:Phosphoribulokinase n=1 Tax=Fodinicola feengrottensis TaxID=435914 RepID=A0ABP4S5Y4_9ACTN|nr:phosphoribulokinase [Fodinicola feengrottensis]